jgi:hypothetical protein
LTVEQILGWADDHHAHTGRWPRCTDLHVRADLNEKWRNIDQLLRQGGRGLEGGSSLPQLMALHRGVRNVGDLAELSEAQILVWADAHRARTGRFPNTEGDSGPVADAPGEKWANIDQALRDGGRGLPGGSSLARLLAQARGVRNNMDLPDLTEDQIVEWAESHRQRTGAWPAPNSAGPVAEAPGETWAGVARSLLVGARGLPGGESLAQLLARRVGKPNHMAVQRLTRELILAWADAHHTRTGRWPKIASGPIVDAPGETWERIHWALQAGLRGLRGRTSLPRLLARYRGARNKSRSPPLTVRKILRWADAHYRRTGRWPVQASGPIPESPDDTWSAVEGALQHGLRGLPGGDTLPRLLDRERRATTKGELAGRSHRF